MCDNRRTMRRERLKAAVLNALRDQLLDPALFEMFCTEYTTRLNELRIERSAALESDKASLAKAKTELDRLIQAILDGVPAAQVKDKMASLQTRKTELESRISHSKEEPVLFHPTMAEHYRTQIAALHDALADESRRAEAATIIRTLGRSYRSYPRGDRRQAWPIDRSTRPPCRLAVPGHK